MRAASVPTQSGGHEHLGDGCLLPTMVQVRLRMIGTLQKAENAAEGAAVQADDATAADGARID